MFVTIGRAEPAKQSRSDVHRTGTSAQRTGTVARGTSNAEGGRDRLRRLGERERNGSSQLVEHPTSLEVLGGYLHRFERCNYQLCQLSLSNVSCLLGRTLLLLLRCAHKTFGSPQTFLVQQLHTGTWNVDDLEKEMPFQQIHVFYDCLAIDSPILT